MLFSGRLGNLLFEYAALVGICAQRGLDPSTCASISKHSKLVDNIELPLGEMIKSFKIPKLSCSFHNVNFREHSSKPYDIKFDPEAFKQPLGTTFAGYFQSYKYFHPHAEKYIKEYFRFDDEVVAKSRRFIDTMKAHTAKEGGVGNGSKIACVSVRRGDKTRNASPIYNPWTLSLDYYNRAIGIIRAKHGDFRDNDSILRVSRDRDTSNTLRSHHTNRTHNNTLSFLFFTGGGFNNSALMEEDRAWVRKNLMRPLLEAGYSVHLEPSHFDHLAAMQTMSLCDEIVVSASSFSWWSAYLSGHNNVIAPNDLQINGVGFAAEDHYLPSWTVLSEEKKRKVTS
jgi:hypothetical protein